MNSVFCIYNSASIYRHQEVGTNLDAPMFAALQKYTYYSFKVTTPRYLL